VFAGVVDLEYGLSRKDHAGRTIGEELQRIGYAGDRPVGHRPVGALFELHIEQGPILEAEGQRIGIVTGGQGTRWYDCEVIGAETHARPSPMESRRDALRRRRAVETSIRSRTVMRPPAGRRSAVQAYPARNTVPGRVRFTVDLRHPDGGTMDAMDQPARGVRAGAERARRLEFDLTRSGTPPVAFDPECIEAVRQQPPRSVSRRARS
jgi:N-carbamoyl-L-amino-acid hydrolase